MRWLIGPWPTPACACSAKLENIGTRVMLSTPAAITTSCVPDMIACAANWIACCEEPHCRSIDTAGTDCGSFDDSTAPRPMWFDCSPACVTQPMITSSIEAGSMPVRSTSALSVSAASSAGCQSLSAPLRRPPAVRTASTI